MADHRTKPGWAEGSGRLFSQVFHAAPLEIISGVLLRYTHLDDAANKIHGSYDSFLGMLADEEQRKHLELLTEAEAEMDSIFQSARKVTHDYRDGLLTVFFDGPLEWDQYSYQKLWSVLMRPIGFSTGALAYSDFRRGIAMASEQCSVIEISALRQPELFPMLKALDSLDLAGFSYVSIHAPSQIDRNWETAGWGALRDELWRKWPMVVHPDALYDTSLWREFGSQLCIENMDKRKPIGRTAKELDRVFVQLPEASLCFDIGHARQCDPTMTEAYLILKEFGSRLRQVHVSEVSTESKHNRLSFTSMLSFREVAHLIPENVPLILETPVTAIEMAEEISRVRNALPVIGHTMVA